MNFLEEKILCDGEIRQGDILKIDSFLNHQIDIDIIRQIAYELQRRFRGLEINKVLTIEASGIAIATMLGHLYDVPVVFAKKNQAANCTDDKYMSQAILREEGYHLESIAIIEEMDYETQSIRFREQPSQDLGNTQLCLKA